MSVSITFAEINHEENAEEGVYLEILSWGQGSGNKNMPLQ